MEKLKLHGMWASPYVFEVIWALKLKDIPYEYIEEDIFTKSQLLLEYNPVHKKVPIFVHAGKPIAESSIILEYIEETWPTSPLLPRDPYERAVARFWISFRQQKLDKIFPSFFTASGNETKQKAAEELLGALKTLEDEGLGDKRFFGGSEINLVDISLGILGLWLDCMQELVGITVLEPAKLPRLYTWVKNLQQCSVIRENLPDKNKLMAHMKQVRERRMREF